MTFVCILCVLLAPEMLIGSYSYSVAKSLFHGLITGKYEHANSKSRCPLKPLNEPQNIKSWQILCFWTLSIVPVLFSSNHNVSETEFCLRLQVKPTQLGPINRARAYIYASTVGRSLHES
jgi:hypothetical protein